MGDIVGFWIFAGGLMAAAGCVLVEEVRAWRRIERLPNGWWALPAAFGGIAVWAVIVTSIWWWL